MFKRRRPWVLGVLSVVTLGFYNFWLIYSWCKEVNGFLGREKVSPLLVLVVGILTCGVSGCAFESVFALDVEQEAKRRNLDASPEIDNARLILGLNVAALILSVTGIGWPIGFVLGTAASVLMQRAFNRVTDVLEQQSMVRVSTTAPFTHV